MVIILLFHDRVPEASRAFPPYKLLETSFPMGLGNRSNGVRDYFYVFQYFTYLLEYFYVSFYFPTFCTYFLKHVCFW